MVRAINIRNLNLDELMGVVSIYPWYAGARKELCARMAAAGTLSEQQLSEAALYVGSRRLLADLVNSGRTARYSDSEVSRLLHNVMSGVAQRAAAAEPEARAETPLQTAPPAAPEPAPEAESEALSAAEAARRIFVVGGDYFSTSQYKEVRHADDNIYSGFATSEREDLPGELPEESFDFCTETLAQIYAEQGYTEEAKQIYSKLSLRYPEKSVYFAALIEKLD